MKMIMQRSLAAALLLAMIAAMAVAAENASGPTVLISSPVAGAKVEGVPFYMTFELKNIPPGRHVVEVACGVFTHFFLIDPADPWIGSNGWYEITDRFFPVGKGANELRVTVRDEDEKTTVAEGSVSFQVIDMSDEKKREASDDARSEISSAAWGLGSSWNSYRREYAKSKTQKDYNQDYLKRAAGSYVNSRNTDFTARIGAFVRLSDFYERCHKPGDALRSLKHAEDIYEEEKELTNSAQSFSDVPVVDIPDACAWAPNHLEGYAVFYARRMALERSAEWLLKVAAFYEDQATRHASNADTVGDAKYRAACMYRKIAQYHFMLDKDLDAYTIWMNRFRQTLPKEKATLGAADYSGIIRGKNR